MSKIRHAVYRNFAKGVGGKFGVCYKKNIAPMQTTPIADSPDSSDPTPPPPSMTNGSSHHPPTETQRLFSQQWQHSRESYRQLLELEDLPRPVYQDTGIGCSNTPPLEMKGKYSCPRCERKFENKIIWTDHKSRFVV